MRRSASAETVQRARRRRDGGECRGPEPASHLGLLPGTAPLFAHLLPVAVSASAGRGHDVPSWNIAPATGPEIAEALELLYQRWPASRRGAMVASALQSASTGELDLRHLLTARDSAGHLQGAVLGVPRPGREAVVWTPAVANAREPAASQVVGELLQELTARLDQTAISCQVCFLEPSCREERHWLAAAGFPGIADLCLLRAPVIELALPGHAPPAARKLQCVWYTPEQQSLFARAIDLVQSDSLDCPEMHGLRTAHDVLASHAESAGAPGGLWRVYTEPGSSEPVAILLLADRPVADQVELLYLGVSPQARGQGLGRWLLTEARELAEELDRGWLEVAVESRNTPALALYEKAGFREFQRHAIHLRMSPHDHRMAAH